MPPARPRRRFPSLALLLAAASLALLAGCGGAGGGSARGSGPVDTSARRNCAQTVLDTLVRVVHRVYREGLASERTAVAQRTLALSAPLRKTVERDDSAGAGAAARALVASGRMTNLRVIAHGRTLADVGGPALAPLRGTLRDAHGRPIGEYVASVWSDEGFLAESRGIAQSLISLRRRGQSVGGSTRLPAGRMAAEGQLTLKGVAYRYAAFGAEAFPRGAVSVYVLKPLASTAALCGHTGEDTLVNTLSRVAALIYAGEGGARTVPQIRRVQTYRPLLEAVARRDPAATKKAIEALLTEHIVRLRVSVGGQLLSDVGGPYVLAPVGGELRLGGRSIGSFILSIQDDEGYLRLTRRLAGLTVLMYMGAPRPQLVKNNLGPNPGAVPESGRYAYKGRSYRVFTVHATAFPQGPLTIRVLVPIPYE